MSGEVAMQAGRGNPGARGFTLIEILISMVILMVGLLGIMSVFPAAMRAATHAVEDTYAAAISQSVVDAIRNGMRNAHAHYPDDTAFFVLDHDGVTVLDPANPGVTQLELDRRAGKFRNLDLDQTSAYTAIRERDYCILLPMKTEIDGSGRGKAYLYPRLNTSDNANRVSTQSVMGPNGMKLSVKKVYMLGQYLGQAVQPPPGQQPASPQTLALEQRDPYPQYSFAFTIRPARGPDPMAPVPIIAQQSIVPNLYEVVVYIYRNFSTDVNSKFNDPVREFVTYVTE